MEKFCLCGLRIEKFFLCSQKGYEKIARGERERETNRIFFIPFACVGGKTLSERDENLEIYLENESFAMKFDEIRGIFLILVQF